MGFKSKNHAYLSKQFVIALRKSIQIPITALMKEVGINYGVFSRWADQTNRINKQDPRIFKLAEIINFQGQLFE